MPSDVRRDGRDLLDRDSNDGFAYRSELRVPRATRFGNQRSISLRVMIEIISQPAGATNITLTAINTHDEALLMGRAAIKVTPDVYPADDNRWAKRLGLC